MAASSGAAAAPGTVPASAATSTSGSGGAGTRPATGGPGTVSSAATSGSQPGAAGPGSVPQAISTATSGQTPGGSSGADEGPDPVPVDTAGPVLLDTTPGRFRTALDPATGRFHFLSPDNQKVVLRGVSLTGAETGTRETAAGAGFWLYLSNQMPEAQNTPTVLRNVVKSIVNDWKSTVVRIPICASAWVQDYVVHDWGNQPIMGYRDWVDVAVREARSAGAVVIIDNHLWAIAKGGNTGVDRGTFTSNGQTHRYAEYEDGCTGVNKVRGIDSCAPKDFYTDDKQVWQCAIANADGVTMHNAYKNKENLGGMWANIAARYAADSGVWFELFNEPYTRKAAKNFPGEGDNDLERDYPWDLWTEFMLTQIQAIRDQARASNVILVNGLDWGYDFGPKYGPIANPDRFLPWKTRYSNIAYAFHPYQHGACCGQIGAGSADESVSDPYQAGFCSFYKDGTNWGMPSGAPLPGGKSCSNRGYAATQDKKMPPCTWVAAAWNPGTQALGLCAGDRVICNPKGQTECERTEWSSPSAGGWSRYVLPMAKYGPLMATEFGSFDCSSPFVSTLLTFMRKFDISYTAWALWPQNSGGPEGLGSCGYPSVISPVADPGDFRACFDGAACSKLMQPMPWAGAATRADILNQTR